MDFESNQQKILTDNQQPIEPDIRDLCKDLSYSCNHYAKKLNTMNMSKKVLDVYTLNVNILDVTNEFWQNLLSIIDRKNKFHMEDLCFSIMNIENCDEFNKFYQNFNVESIKYMKEYIGPENHDYYLGLVKKLFTSFDLFLQLTLPSLEKSINGILFVIDTPDGNGSFTHDYYAKPYVADLGNMMFLKYLRKLQDLFSGFKIVDPSSELIEMKEQIEFKVNRAIDANVEILKTTKQVINVKSSTTSTTEPATVLTSTMFAFESTSNPNIPSSTDFRFPPSSTSSKTTKAVFYDSSGKYFYSSDDTYKDNVTEPTFKATENPKFISTTTILSDNKTNFDDIIKLSNNISDTLPGDQSSVVNSTSVTYWIIFGSLFSVIGFIIFIAFGVKKYILRKKKLIGDRSIRLNNENSNSVAFNKY